MLLCSNAYANQKTFGDHEIEDDLVVTDAATIGGILTTGDGGVTNYAQFAADGELVLYGTARVEKYMVIGIAQLVRVVGGAPPDVSTEGTFGTLLFANTGTEDVYFNVHIPVDWCTGTDLKVAIYWAPTDGTDAKGVAWEFDWEAVAGESNEALGAGNTHVDIHDATQGVDNELLETGYGVIAGASVTVDDTIGINLYRDHDDLIDDYGSDAALIHIEIEYIVDRLGEAL